MNMVTKTISKLARGLQAVLLLLMLGYSAVVAAQNVLAGAQVGTIQLVRQDDGYITISGTNHNFDYEVTVVTIGGEEYDSTYLNEGMVVRFTLNRERVLERIEIIGPANLVRQVTPES